ncbi:MAG: HIT domain-containing protein [Candidatus Diapherotrites archaeon]|nr:HIT domain-containing protein [Candidatus Diapherotrites archaeon]
MQKACVYCSNPDIQKRKIVENETAWVFPTNIPITPGHLLVCPKRCVKEFEELNEKEVEDLFDLMKKSKNVLRKAFGAEGFNIAWNEGETAGQKIPHFHLHVVPRKKGDEGITEYEPRKFLYRPGSREETPEKELQKIAEILKKEFG